MEMIAILYLANNILDNNNGKSQDISHKSLSKYKNLI